MIVEFRYYAISNGNNFFVGQYDVPSFNSALELFRTNVLDFVFDREPINANLIIDDEIICQYFGDANKFVNRPDFN